MAKASFDQIAALVRGVTLPLEPISEDHLDAIVEGISQAFEEARAEAPAIVATGNEPAVTALLASHLNRRIDEDSIWRTLVVSVGRGTESLNFNGEKLEKRPDLSITFAARSRRFPLIVEAKIVENESGKTVRLYCDKGIKRFLDGEYAWACQEAFMVAYVRGNTSQMSTLEDRLSNSVVSGETPYGTLDGPTKRLSHIGELAITQHARKFTYPSQNPPDNAPGPVHLWHLWLG